MQMAGQKSSGPPAQLLGTVKASGKARPNAIPQADEGVIAGMETAAEDGTTQGSMNRDTGAVPSNGALNKALPGFGSLIAPGSVNVP
jgi:hypothetical protein